jgi:aspartate/methionine/tyrosine aminotransferase
MEAIVDLARRNKIYLFFDEVYRGLEIDSSQMLPPAACLYEKAISLGVMSKSFGMAGLRIGWIVCKDDELMEKMCNYKHYLSICNSGPSEVLAIIALRNEDAIIARNRAIVSKNLDLIDSFLQKWSHIFSWTRPLGGCCGFMRFQSPSDITLEDFAKLLVEKYSILILPGSMYPGKEEDVKCHFRFGFGRENFCSALEAFEQALEELF